MQVSVIIPVYNAAPFLDKCIQSALNQRQTGEIILIDDRSTDGSWESCQAWKKKESKIKIFRNEGVKGAGAARNIGLRNATCEYIAFLDADDYYLEGRFDEDEKILTHFEQNHATSNAVIIKTIDTKNHTILNDLYENNKVYQGLTEHSMYPLKEFIETHSIHLLGITFRKIELQKLFFDESFKQCQDSDFLLRFLSNKNLYINNKIPKVQYNIHQFNTIKNLQEARKYRLKYNIKLFKVSLEKLIGLKTSIKIFKIILELNFFGTIFQHLKYKKIFKIIISPFLLITIFFKK